MIATLIILTILLIIVTSYLLYYKSQISQIGNQLAFITEHDSFKLIRTQLSAKEITKLITLSNKLLTRQRKLNQQFIKRNEEINDTIVSLSHDIRTPLTSLAGYLQLIERTDDSQDKQDYLKQAQSRTTQINRLVDELFLYTKMENKEYVLELESIDLVNLIEKSLLIFIDQFTQSGYEPAIDLPDSPSYIKANNSALERIFENIIKNYFVHGAGPLTVLYEESDQEITVGFSNELKAGASINLENLFSRFYKDDRSRTVHSSGLGLSIVKVLMEKMDGRVRATMKESEFSLHLIFNKTGGERNHGSSSINY